MGLNEMRVFWVFALLVILAETWGCSAMKIEESTPQAVSIRYDGVIQTLKDATEVARQNCALHGKTAYLRKVDETTTAERYAHFDCVSR
jgi:hypothetical protein